METQVQLPDPNTIPLIGRSLDSNLTKIRNRKKYGEVPVQYIPSKASLTKSMPPGLRNAIEQSTSKSEVQTLLANGKSTYTNASPSTIKSWEAAATKKILELNS